MSSHRAEREYGPGPDPDDTGGFIEVVYQGSADVLWVKDSMADQELWLSRSAALALCSAFDEVRRCRAELPDPGEEPS